MKFTEIKAVNRLSPENGDTSLKLNKIVFKAPFDSITFEGIDSNGFDASYTKYFLDKDNDKNINKMQKLLFRLRIKSIKPKTAEKDLNAALVGQTLNLKVKETDNPILDTKTGELKVIKYFVESI